MSARAFVVMLLLLLLLLLLANLSQLVQWQILSMMESSGGRSTAGSNSRRHFRKATAPAAATDLQPDSRSRSVIETGPFVQLALFG